MNILEEIKFIPTTRYKGSKRKILPWLYDCVKDIVITLYFYTTGNCITDLEANSVL